MISSGCELLRAVDCANPHIDRLASHGVRFERADANNMRRAIPAALVRPLAVFMVLTARVWSEQDGRARQALPSAVLPAAVVPPARLLHRRGGQGSPRRKNVDRPSWDAYDDNGRTEDPQEKAAAAERHGSGRTVRRIGCRLMAIRPKLKTSSIPTKC